MLHKPVPGGLPKRVFDVLFSAAALILLSPVMLSVAMAIRLKLGTPIIFTQPRVGFNGTTFQLRKFRTMSTECDSSGELLPDSKRLGQFGLWLRSSSLDELPSLWNILSGEMSLVGPRPLLLQYLPLYTKRQARRHEVQPGLTGWVQIRGRNRLSWEEKFELDVWYVENRSFVLDLKIIALTIGKVLKRDGISAEGEVTMPFFTGKKIDAGENQGKNRVRKK